MKKISLNELMGGKGRETKKRKLTLDDLEDLMGERLPKMEFSPRGRYRLLTALRNRFGDNFKALHGISDILEEFDKEAEFNVRLHEMKMIKGKAKESK